MSLFHFLLPFSLLYAIEDDAINDLLAARVCSNLFHFLLPFSSLSAVKDDAIDDLLACSKLSVFGVYVYVYFIFCDNSLK